MASCASVLCTQKKDILHSYMRHEQELRHFLKTIIPCNLFWFHKEKFFKRIMRMYSETMIRSIE